MPIPQLIVERDRWCCATLRRNAAGQWPEPFEGDIRSVDFREFEAKVDLVTGGPPCQPFSLGGKHKAHADHRDMWSEAVRAVRETRPRAFVFENVKGLTRSSFSAYFNYITLQLTYPELTRTDAEAWPEHLARLEQHHSSGRRTGLQYQVIPPRVLNAADYGVPQRRERVFFIGFRDDICANWAFPKATHSLEALHQDQSERGSYWDLHRLPRSRAGGLRAIRNEANAALSHGRQSAMPWPICLTPNCIPRQHRNSSTTGFSPVPAPIPAIPAARSICQPRP